MVADHQRLSVTVLRERYADTDQVGHVLIDRVGGALANPDAVRIGIV
jgi:HK97 family phage major capsid protein